MRFIPLHIANQFAGVRVNQQFMRVKTVTIFRVVRPMDAKPIQCAGFQSGNVAVPDFMGVLRQIEPCNLLFAVGSIETQLNALRVGGKEREVDALTIVISTELVIISCRNGK